MLEIRQILHDGCLSAEGVAVVFDSYAEDLEKMHADGGVLDASLGLQHDVDGTREERNKRVALTGGHEDAQEFDLQDLAHGLEGSEKVYGGIPSLWGRGSFSLTLTALSPGRRCGSHGGGFFGGAGLKGGNGPLGEEAVDFEEVAVVLEDVGLGGFDVGVQEVGFRGEAGGNEVDNLAEGGSGEGGEISVGHVLTQSLVRSRSVGSRTR